MLTHAQTYVYVGGCELNREQKDSKITSRLDRIHVRKSLEKQVRNSRKDCYIHYCELQDTTGTQTTQSRISEQWYCIVTRIRNLQKKDSSFWKTVFIFR